MKFLAVLLVISLLGYSWSQPLDDEENFDNEEEEVFFVDDEIPETTEEYITNSTVNNIEDGSIDPEHHRFGNGQPSNLGSSCAVGVFIVDRINCGKKRPKKFSGNGNNNGNYNGNNNKGNNNGNYNGNNPCEVILQRGSVTTAALVHNGNWVAVPYGSDLVRRAGNKRLAIKQANNRVILVSNFYVLQDVDLVVLKLCRLATGIPACTFTRQQACATSDCSAMPSTTSLIGFNVGNTNRDPNKSLTQATGTSAPCPDNQPQTCCITSSQTFCANDVGAIVVAQNILYGAVVNNYNCQAQSIYRIKAFSPDVIWRLYINVFSLAPCGKCSLSSPVYPQYV